MFRASTDPVAAIRQIRRAGLPAAIFASVMLAAIWATFAAYTVDLWNSIEEEAEQELYGAKKVMRAHITSVFRAADVLLNVTDHWLSEDLADEGPQSLEDLRLLLGRLQGSGDQLVTVGLIDEGDNGFWRVEPGKVYESGVFLGDREYIQALRDQPSGARFVGAPIVVRNSNLRTVPVVLRAKPNALSVKYIAAYLTEETFRDAFSHLTDIAPAIVGIARDDGLILFVWPPNDDFRGTHIDGFSDVISAGRADVGATDTLPAPDGSGLLLATYGAVPEQPLHVFASIRKSDLVDLFWRTLALPLLLAVLTTFVICLLGIWLMHLMEREADKTAKLSDALMKAETANESKSQFLANMSHELRTPLNAIIGFSDILCREMFGPLGSAKYRDYSNDIRDAGRHLLGIISQILDLAKIDSGTLANTLSTTDLGEVAEACLRLLSVNAEERQIEIVSDKLEGLPPVWIEPVHLRQVILNLVGNAIKFSHEGGTIKISVAAIPNGQLQVTVRDYGIGIGPESMRELFQPFAQVEKSLSRQYGGVGLGLVNTRRLVEAYGGKVWLESEYGAGTAAIFTLRVATVSGAQQT